MNKLTRYPPSLTFKKGKWYVEITIPKDIKHLYSNQKQKQRSTGTADKRIARQKVHDIATKLYAEFELKAKQSPWQTLVKELALEKICYSEREYVSLEYDYYEPITFKHCPITAVEAKGAISSAQRQIELWRHAKEDNDSFYLIEKGLFYSSIHKAEEYLLDVATQLKKEFPEMVSDHPTRPFQTPSPLPKIELSQDLSPLFSTLVDGYLESKVGKDVSQRRLACARAVTYIGDKPIDQYDRVDAIDMAKKMDVEGYSNKRIKTIISYVRVVFIYAGTIRGRNAKVVLERHAWTDLKLASYGTRTRSYKPFSKDELHLLFNQSIPKQERLLLSILMTTGMRLDEAALMTWERIVKYQDILCFSLLPSDEHGTVIVKNEGSKRYIPLPDIIRPLLSESGEGRLFDYRTHNGKAQAKASDALMPFIRNVSADDRKVVHSLRGNLKDLIRDANYSKEINDFLTGHAQGDVAGRYGQGPSIAKRLEVLNSIDHQCLIKL